MKKINRVGETFTNKYGENIKIVKYINAENVIIEFKNGYTKKVRYASLRNKEVKNNSLVHIGSIIGFIGNTSSSEKKEDCYLMWVRMLRRVDSNRNPYMNASVCSDWLNYIKFKEWYFNNIYTIEGEVLELDKDILSNKKLYSPDNCLLVPKKINSLFVGHSTRKSKHMIGVIKTINNTYISRFSKDNKIISIGTYKTEIEAFNEYKKEKEKYIKEVADSYKNKIPKKVYKALCDYKIVVDK